MWGTIEELRTNEEFTGRAENTLGSYLLPEFDKRDWLWPKHPVVWKLHFIEYHVEMLFKKEEESDAATENRSRFRGVSRSSLPEERDSLLQARFLGKSLGNPGKYPL